MALLTQLPHGFGLFIWDGKTSLLSIYCELSLNEIVILPNRGTIVLKFSREQVTIVLLVLMSNICNLECFHELC